MVLFWSAAPGADSDEAGTLERLGWRLMEVLRAGLAKSGPVVLLAPVEPSTLPVAMLLPPFFRASGAWRASH